MHQQFIGQSSLPLNNNINTAVILAAGRGERISGQAIPVDGNATRMD